MKIVIPTPTVTTPPYLALQCEGIPALEYPCPSRTAYGELMTELWNDGEPFVLIEWDIVPAPGNVTALSVCPEPWCAHKYPFPIPGKKGTPMLGFGLNKITPQGLAPETWATTIWENLDGPVIAELRGLYGAPHLHEPPVAHARRP